MRNWTIGVSFAVFIVYMQRHHRWGYMMKAMEGAYTVAGSPRASNTPVIGGSNSSSSYTSNSGPFPSTSGAKPAPPNAPTNPLIGNNPLFQPFNPLSNGIGNLPSTWWHHIQSQWDDIMQRLHL